ncbi:beta-1,6-N-acetylglucosaminyltransferase [Paracoccus tegillarcae]|uniref:Peptide O-xylosyltransferase n=1 Tax=Paracoccus tegillarcae TaxID=1529068 RepID=A0A2K9EPQ9_9RHOB|nr:beta-1,6-N-acetylglucosaminyltransferase [Paracoccus tegillarcae]AUH32706.1 glycosyl transferase [Paracoccus tegillarcae]
MAEDRAPEVRLGVALLCHSRLQTAARIAQIWADGGAEVMIHVDAKADPQEFTAMQATLSAHPNIHFSTRRACNWGRFDLVQATQDAATTLMALVPEVSHVFLASGSCLPLRPVAELVEYLRAHPGYDFIESVAVDDVFWAIGGLNEERFTRYFPFDWRKQRKLFDRSLDWQRRMGITRRQPKRLVPHLGSQWWCLTRQTLTAILNDSRRAEFDRFFRLSWIPDESYFQSLARLHSQHVESRSLTLSRFDHLGKPYLLYDDHVQMLEESGSFVARKIWHGAEKLMQHFPQASAEGQAGREPDPSRIERMLSRATTLRRSGRPGLYMQSRFPRQYHEHGKTAAGYAVLQGFAQLIPGFEEWLAARVDADVHGHLFAPGGAEFAGRADLGPGALPSNPKLRDYDPERFLSSLVRVTERMQVFQFGPGDSQALNWFMATDPNARLMVVTGAWLVPLYHSDLPFDQLRRIAAKMQHAETEQFRVLNSRWLRARVKLWDLAEFAARPADVVSTALSQLDLGIGEIDDLPPMLEFSGIGAFLQRMRNAGLRPELTGHFPPTDPASQQRQQS